MSERLEWRSPPRQPEAIRWRLINGILAFTLVVFALGVLAMGLMYRARAARLNPAGASVPAPLGRETIDELEQVPFPLERRAYAARAAALERLRSYGWTDRRAGIAHVPVDVAIDALVAAPPGAPTREHHP